MLKPFERLYLICAPFLPALYGVVRREMRRVMAAHPGEAALLDVGGRKSHYTIGLPATVTISDLPRLSNLQHELNLGATDAAYGQLKRRRSNVAKTVYDDMTRTALSPGSFDIVLAVEVLEHVEEDAAFVANVSKVLKPGGVFVMTTPNGDFVLNQNPDHKRHYRREELVRLLQKEFAEVEVYYAVAGGRFRKWGLLSWSPMRPFQTLKSMIGNFLNRIQSKGAWVKSSPQNTHHLIAAARKSIAENSQSPDAARAW